MIVTVPREEECKFWLHLCLFLVRDVLYAECARAENAVLGAEGFGVDWLGVCVKFDLKIGDF